MPLFVQKASLALSVGVDSAVPFWSFGDLDGNGVRELIVAASSPSTFRSDLPIALVRPQVFSATTSSLANTTANFLPETWAGAQSPSGVHVSDLNGDGRQDLFVTDTGIDYAPYPGRTQHLLLSSGTGPLSLSGQTTRVSWTHTSAAADIDLDGDMDFYVSDNRHHDQSLTPYLWINDGAGNFTVSTNRLPDYLLQSRPFPATSQRYSDEVFDGSGFADVNRDGAPDLLLFAKFDTAASRVLLNDGTGNFRGQAIALPPGLHGPGGMTYQTSGTLAGQWTFSGTQNWRGAFGDINGDGLPDLVLGQMAMNQAAGVSYAGGRIQILINQGGTAFLDETAGRISGAQLDMRNHNSFVHQQLADIDGDGDLDLAAFQIDDSAALPFKTHYFVNNGSGFFSPLTDPGLPTVGAHALDDIDGDGDADAVQLDYRVTGSQPNGLGLFTLNARVYENQSVSALIMEAPADGGWVSGATGGDTLTGKAGADVLLGFGLGDRLFGAGGNDILLGGTGNDSLDGGDGNDWMQGDSGSDTLRGGAGNDTLVPGGFSPDVGIDVSFGGSGDDLIVQAAASGTLNGEDGNDFLWGAMAADTLRGGLGNDELVGLGGNDTFLFLPADLAGGQVDTIYSFGDYAGDNDVIRFGGGIASSAVSVASEGAGARISVNLGGGATHQIFVWGMTAAALQDDLLFL
jgi:Ca2+-binding RTX toxin-like protein